MSSSCLCTSAGVAHLGPIGLSDPRDRARVYEQVLREGNEDDVRWFIRVDELMDLWD